MTSVRESLLTMSLLGFDSLLAGRSTKALIVLSIATFWPGAAGAGDVLTQHNNNLRTGAILDEKLLNAQSLHTGNFGKLWTLFADGQIVAQPLYVANLAIDTPAKPGVAPVKGTFNTVIIATMHNTVYAYDADNERGGTNGQTIPLWATWLGQPRSDSGDIDMWSTNYPEWGIVGTPVVSDDRKTLYLVAWHNDGPEGLRYKLHALDLASGAERNSAVIRVSSTDNSKPCNSAQSEFNPCQQKQRSSLLLSNGILYLGFGGDGNRGALMAFDAVSFSEKAFWNVTPTGVNGGVWMSGQGPSADAEGNVYLMTANGTLDPKNGDYGDSFVRLRLEGEGLSVKDYFAPCDQDFLSTNDLDLGSAGPVLIPDTPPLIIGGGKQGVLYVLLQTNMGGYVGDQKASSACESTNARQQVLAFPPVVHDGTHYGNIHGSPVYWNGPDAERIYAWGENSKLKAYVLKDGRLDATAPKQSQYQPPLGMPGGMLSLSADGGKAGTGILWAVVPLNGDANKQRGVQGIVLALDAEDVSQTLWTSEQAPARDHLGLFAKFVPPTVAGGKLFVATYGNFEPLRNYTGGPPAQYPSSYYVAVYGVGARPAPQQTAAVEAGAPPPHYLDLVDQNSEDVTVVRAATGPLTLNTKDCKQISESVADCSDALSRETGRPSLHNAFVSTEQNPAGCDLLRVTTAGKDDALKGATGIGFYSAQARSGDLAADDSGRFVSKAELVKIGTARLKDGSAATLFEFVGVVNCAGNEAQDSSILFKPYMQFENAGRIYRNWDFAGNYRLSRKITAFDRASDVLQ